MDRHKRKVHDGDGDWRWFTQFAGIRMESNYYTFHLMSKVIDENPQLRQIVEFGTYSGSMAAYLGLEGLRRSLPVYTFDIHPHLSSETNQLLQRLGVKQRTGDLFDEKVRDEITTMLKDVSTYLIIDNGDKKREFELYVPLLASGSVVSVHDYGTEFLDEHWQIHKNLVEPYMREEWENHNVEFASFKVV